MGPGPVQAHLDHAGGFAEAIGEAPAGLLLDLGSGAGLPGLALAVAWPATEWLVVDVNRRSADFLREASAELGLVGRVTVVQARAEEFGRDSKFRESVQTVVARSFGPPAATAECAAGFLAVGGRLVVSDPPEQDSRRWLDSGLMTLGQRVVRQVESNSGHHFTVIEQIEPANDRFPRRTGVPARRPLF
ncbi:MAG: class I SAM-dependent methyltransferase [Actinomycetota bacterium]|nr:class I SAM-dependent methyltransferase [Actinomycetota bacterium]